MGRVTTNRAATVGERFSFMNPDRFLTGAALKEACKTRSWSALVCSQPSICGFGVRWRGGRAKIIFAAPPGESQL